MSVRRIGLLHAIVMLWSLCALGQAPDVQPMREGASAPVVIFELNWREADPQWYYISVASTGAAAYKSQPHLQEGETPGDPFTMEFTASQPTRTRIFDLAKAVNFFNGNFAYKGKIANTGTKTLTYRDGAKQSSTNVNYSSNAQLTQLITVFQHISTTMEFGRRLAYQIRFDKLGVEAILKRMEEMNKQGMLLEIQAIEPLLKQIATDRSFMNVSRQRAQRLLGATAAPAGGR